MKKLTRIVAGLLVFSTVASSLVSCTGKSASNDAQQQGDELSGNISLSGAFALYPLAVKWQEEFIKLHPNVKIDLSAGGAGKGMTDALAKVVDLGMVSREVYPEEIAKGALGIAVAKDAVVPTINANNPFYEQLKTHGLTQEAAQKIWITGEYTTWGQVLGTDDTTPIHVYTRSDACGAAETFALWLGKKQDDLLGTAVFGDPGLAEAVQKDPLGIGLNNIGYAYDEDTRKFNPGIAVFPVDKNANGQIDPEEEIYDTKDDFIKAVAEDKYPSPPARDLYLVSNGVPTNPAVVAFLEFILTEGQQYNVPVGYISLSQDKLDRGLNLLHGVAEAPAAE